MMKLTPAMLGGLHFLRERERGNIHFLYRTIGSRSLRWSTMVALERRGLAAYRYDSVKRRGTFDLTDEGRMEAAQWLPN